MIPHGEAVRNAVRVEWMRLDDREALRQAGEWLIAHGVHSASYGDALSIWDDKSVRMTAHVGQWLAFNPASGEFTVWDAERFAEAHSDVATAADDWTVIPGVPL